MYIVHTNYYFIGKYDKIDSSSKKRKQNRRKMKNKIFFKKNQFHTSAATNATRTTAKIASVNTFILINFDYIFWNDWIEIKSNYNFHRSEVLFYTQFFSKSFFSINFFYCSKNNVRFKITFIYCFVSKHDPFVSIAYRIYWNKDVPQRMSPIFIQDNRLSS